jgi:hypothetical protein
MNPKMDWKTAIRAWRQLPPAEQLERRRARAVVQTWQSMAFEREMVDLDWLKAQHAALPSPTAPHATSTPPKAD